MRKRILSDLLCPNTKADDIFVFGKEVVRGDELLCNLEHSEILDSDAIKGGVIYCMSAGTAYPICDYVASLLNDNDAEFGMYNRLLSNVRDCCPAEVGKIVDATLARLNAVRDTAESAWNKEEMAYYDQEVSTAEKRQKMLERIWSEPTWNIFLERAKHLLRQANIGSGSSVLEVGCGNARTMAWLAPPMKLNYSYVGIDISYYRLLLAKAAMPDGDFIQASALNLPFRGNSFSTVIAFSSLHHLISPIAGFRESTRCTRNGGMLLINEPILKPKLLEGMRLGWVRRLFETYEHSVHDNAIDVSEFEKFFVEANLNVTHRYYYASILRTVLSSKPVTALGLTKFKLWWQFVIPLDLMFIKLFCKHVNVLGPGGISIAMTKNAPNNNQINCNRHNET